MAEDATNESMLTILRDLQEGQKALRRDMDARFDEVGRRLDVLEAHLETNSTMTSGLAGMAALAYGRRLKAKPRVPAE